MKIFLLVFYFFIIKLSSQELIINSKHSNKQWGYILSSSLVKWKDDYLEQILSQYDILSINGLELNGRGQLRYTLAWSEKISKTILSKKENKQKIYPMVVVSSVRDGIELLNSKKSQFKSIEQIKLFLKENELKGIHFDIEYLPIEFDSKLADYFKLAKEEFSKESIILTASFFPQIGFNSSISKLHNPELLSQSVDQIVIMSYDYHNKKTEAGCVTSYDLSKKNITEILKYFKPNQVWLGIPAYGYEWFINKKKVNILSSYDGKERQRVNKGTREESGCIKIIKQNESILYFPDKETRDELSKLSEEFNLTGTALWRLGLEERN